ncbi:hypothetical protein EYF80_040535 [Liparis tanakae]|uniref:Uncharacterized protein n=1 Tax=Liparis tanakae TaxID=230148 RepID=A0A4Z2G6P6_9TELE|nr:hypothetical protein EYF80_040535 [Liparis tanakae]
MDNVKKPRGDSPMETDRRSEAGTRLWTYSGDVVRRLSERLEDVDGRREVDVLEVVHRLGVGAGILLQLHVLDHLRLELTSAVTHVTSNFSSCTARHSQNPSMANLEAAYTSLNTTPSETHGILHRSCSSHSN